MGLVPDGTPLSLQCFFLDHEIRLQRQRLKHMLELGQEPLGRENGPLSESHPRPQTEQRLKHQDPDHQSACPNSALLSHDRCLFSARERCPPVRQMSALQVRTEPGQPVGTARSSCSSSSLGSSASVVSEQRVPTCCNDERIFQSRCSHAASPSVLSHHSTDGVKQALAGDNAASPGPAGSCACTISLPTSRIGFSPNSQVNVSAVTPLGQQPSAAPCSFGELRGQPFYCDPNGNASKKLLAGRGAASQDVLVGKGGVAEEIPSLKKSVTRLDLSMAVYQRMRTVDIPRGTESEVLEEVQEVLVGSPRGREDLVQSEGSGDDLSALLGLNQRLAERVEDLRGEGTGTSPESLGREASKLQILAEKLQAQEEEKRVIQEESFQVEQLLKRQYYQDMQKKEKENAHLKRQLDGLKEEVEALNRHLSATLQHRDHLKYALALAQDAFTHAVDSMLFTPRTPGKPGPGRIPAEQLKKTVQQISLRPVPRGTPDLPKCSEAPLKPSTAARGADQETSERKQNGKPASAGLSAPGTSSQAGPAETTPDAEGELDQHGRDEVANDEGGSLSAKLWSLMERLEDAVGQLDSFSIDGADRKALTTSLRKTCSACDIENTCGLGEDNHLRVSSYGEQHKKSQPQQPENSLLGEAASAWRNFTSHDSNEHFDVELNEEQLYRLRKEVTALRQSLKFFTGGVLAAQKRHREAAVKSGRGGGGEVFPADGVMLQRFEELQNLNARLLLDNTLLHQLYTSGTAASSCVSGGDFAQTEWSSSTVQDLTVPCISRCYPTLARSSDALTCTHGQEPLVPSAVTSSSTGLAAATPCAPYRGPSKTGSPFETEISQKSNFLTDGDQRSGMWSEGAARVEGGNVANAELAGAAVGPDSGSRVARQLWKIPLPSRNLSMPTPEKLPAPVPVRVPRSSRSMAPSMSHPLLRATQRQSKSLNGVGEEGALPRLSRKRTIRVPVKDVQGRRSPPGLSCRRSMRPSASAVELPILRSTVGAPCAASKRGTRGAWGITGLPQLEAYSRSQKPANDILPDTGATNVRGVSSLGDSHSGIRSASLTNGWERGDVQVDKELTIRGRGFGVTGIHSEEWKGLQRPAVFHRSVHRCVNSGDRGGGVMLPSSVPMNMLWTTAQVFAGAAASLEGRGAPDEARSVEPYAQKMRGFLPDEATLTQSSPAQPPAGVLLHSSNWGEGRKTSSPASLPVVDHGSPSSLTGFPSSNGWSLQRSLGATPQVSYHPYTGGAAASDQAFIRHPSESSRSMHLNSVGYAHPNLSTVPTTLTPIPTASSAGPPFSPESFARSSVEMQPRSGPLQTASLVHPVTLVSVRANSGAAGPAACGTFLRTPRSVAHCQQSQNRVHAAHKLQRAAETTGGGDLNCSVNPMPAAIGFAHSSSVPVIGRTMSTSWMTVGTVPQSVPGDGELAASQPLLRRASSKSAQSRVPATVAVVGCSLPGPVSPLLNETPTRSSVRQKEPSVRGRSLTSPLKKDSAGSPHLSGSPDSTRPIRVEGPASTADGGSDGRPRLGGSKLSPVRPSQAKVGSPGTALPKSPVGTHSSVPQQPTGWVRPGRDLATASTAGSSSSGGRSGEQSQYQGSLCGLRVLCDVPLLQHSSVHRLCGASAPSQRTDVSTPKGSDIDGSSRALGSGSMSVSTLQQLPAR
ncbi:hypothetical protein CSUI_003607 [Cystoisospora suis]|uniref:Uncharacterized protein n=1 Tax=Cystoisospora suis TaxID=483139 RepID=A0A2C6L4C2_9APIC|nr:hypothetical protein CSUI_003607 [Cystoisospora suis]